MLWNNFGHSVKTEADMSMLNTSISVGKIKEKETNTSACYTGIISVKMNSVDIVKTEADMSMLNTSISVGKINRERDKYKCVLYRNNFGQNKFSGHCQDRS